MAAQKLKAMTSVTATVVGKASRKRSRFHELAPGDVVHLSAGDMIPAGERPLTPNDSFVDQGKPHRGSLTEFDNTGFLCPAFKAVPLLPRLGNKSTVDAADHWGMAPGGQLTLFGHLTDHADRRSIPVTAMVPLPKWRPSAEESEVEDANAPAQRVKPGSGSKLHPLSRDVS